jgi:hypothetical protein
VINKLGAIAVATVIMFALERWGEFRWYWALALAWLGYGCVRYVGYVVRERRYIKSVMDAVSRDQFSN